jgi:hypothetical protein
MPELLADRSGGRPRARSSWPRAVGSPCIRGCVAVLFLGLQLSGCFHYLPVGQPAPAVGTEVRFGVTDRGRVELTPVFGPGLLRVSGTLQETTDTTLVVSVTGVDYLGMGFTVQWAGERTEVPRDLITDVRERRLSRTRTGIAAGVIAATAIAIAFLGIRGFGDDGPGSRPDPGNGQEQ